MRTYCLACREHTNIFGSKRVTMANKVIRDKSRCTQYLSKKSRFLKQKPNKKGVIKYYRTNMLTYCLVCKKDIVKKNAKMVKTKNGTIALSSKCIVCSNRKSRFMTEQETKGLLTNLGIKAPLSKIPLLNILLRFK